MSSSDPGGFALIMICTGVFALVIAAVQHQTSMRAMKESSGVQPKSVVGAVARLVGLLGLLAIAGVLFKV